MLPLVSRAHRASLNENDPCQRQGQATVGKQDRSLTGLCCQKAPGSEAELTKMTFHMASLKMFTTGSIICSEHLLLGIQDRSVTQDGLPAVSPQDRFLGIR